jgi:hypothetical protein
MESGFMTKVTLYTMEQHVEQSKKDKIVWPMEDLTQTTFTIDGNQMNAIFQGLNQTLFFT